MKQKLIFLSIFFLFLSVPQLSAQENPTFPEQRVSLNCLYASVGMLSMEYRLNIPFNGVFLSPGFHAEFYIPIFGKVLGDAWGYRALVDSKLYSEETDDGIYIKMGTGCGFTSMGNYFLDNFPEISVSFYDQKTKTTYTVGLEYFCFIFTGGVGWNFPINDSFFIDIYAGTNIELRLQPDSASYHGRPDLCLYVGYAL